MADEIITTTQNENTGNVKLSAFLPEGSTADGNYFVIVFKNGKNFSNSAMHIDNLETIISEYLTSKGYLKDDSTSTIKGMIKDINDLEEYTTSDKLNKSLKYYYKTDDTTTPKEGETYPQRTIFIGTNDPTNPSTTNIGNNGDIYLKY